MKRFRNLLLILVGGTLCVCVTLAAAVGGAGPTATQAPKPTAPTGPTPTPAATLTAKETLAAIAKDIFGDGAVSADFRDPKHVVVQYDPGPQWDESSLVQSSVREFIAFSPRVFSSFPDVVMIDVSATASFKDTYGNSKDAVAIRFALARSTADKINWPEFNAKNLACVLTMNNDGSELFVHPSLLKAWNQYENTGLINPSGC